MPNKCLYLETFFPRYIRFDGENQNCWVLGVPVTLAQLHAHHSLYHDVGGRTDDESKNCVMILVLKG